MTAADLRHRARRLRASAAELDRRAGQLVVEADRIEVVLNPIFAVFTPQVWAGPAAARAWQGYVDANRAVHRTAADVRARATDLRRQAHAARGRAGELERLAAQVDAAERATTLTS